jgi:threonylcarbamoyladenosine tRNA methylthiotransferase MtaB
MGAPVPKKPRSPSSAAPSRAPVAIGFVSLGCSKNLVDLQVMAAELHQGGFDIGVEVDETDAVIVNTCAVTAEAEAQVRQAIRRARRERPQAEIIVTGCAAQTESETFAAMPEVTRVLGNHEKMQPATWAALAGPLAP